MRLYLMRHGDAIKPAAAFAQRPLSDKGEREADAAGAFLLVAREMPDTIFHSTQLRSRMTAERVMAGLAAAGDILKKREDLEEDSSPEEFISSVVSEFGKTDRKIMAVGHNPFVTRLASLLLLGFSSAIGEFKTGALLAFDSIASGRAWEVRFYMPPKLLTKIHRSILDTDTRFEG
ncbi:MAG: histidine phosphatase family protein [Synergistaceae bacterium]|nr:histidine phosphatase family protein [Synergistaceae bacterium]